MGRRDREKPPEAPPVAPEEMEKPPEAPPVEAPEVNGVVKEFHADGSLTVELNDGSEAKAPAAEVAQEVPAKHLKLHGEGKV